ncbi:MAG: type III-A CRISPR-associated protein Csm2 [Arcobacteraceae bacterium]|jgi:CRISPR-associated protein Csm2|nr:type III-A CRISPR-associated protein Csm2 [Arcobacteraceae bacterium]
MAIELDYTKNSELFNSVAEDWAKKIGNKVKNTQIRKFYDYILDYTERSKNMNQETFTSEILPFIKMLNSKVAYASTRSSGGGSLVNEAFVQMIKDGIVGIKSVEDLRNFKLFFEAVIGFHRAIEKE